MFIIFICPIIKLCLIHTAFKRFFNGVSGFPKFKRKGKSDVKMYFVKNNASDCLCERHRIKIPTLGWVRLKEKGYIPVSKDGYHVRSGTVSSKAGRYFVSVLIEMPDIISNNSKSPGIGIDLGIINGCSTGKREQRSLSRMYENKKKGGTSNGRNITKQVLKIQELHHGMDNIRTDHINKTISEIVKTKPSYIVIEDLNVSGMMKNRHLAKAAASQKLYGFRSKLAVKCRWYGIELRIADRFYPSSKRCHHCGYVKKDLKLSERTYHCDACGYTNDRDVNARLNLRDAKEYKTA